jgi:hypothetical protein
MTSFRTWEKKFLQIEGGIWVGEGDSFRSLLKLKIFKFHSIDRDRGFADGASWLMGLGMSPQVLSLLETLTDWQCRHDAILFVRRLALPEREPDELVS